MSDDDVLNKIMQFAQGEEAWEVRHFVVYRENGNPVEVLLHDRQFDAPTGRYSVELRTPDPSVDARSHSGNPGRTIEEALSNAHWDQFR